MTYFKAINMTSQVGSGIPPTGKRRIEMFSFQSTIFSFMSFLYMSFSHFYIETLFFFLLIHMSSLYNMDINPLSLTLFMMDFCVKKFKIFIQSKFINISLYEIFPSCSAIPCELINWQSALINVNLAIMN